MMDPGSGRLNEAARLLGIKERVSEQGMGTSEFADIVGAILLELVRSSISFAGALEERLKRLFPGLIFRGDEVEWKTGKYVRGYKGKDQTLCLDGEFSAEQLQALAEWMNS